MRTWQLRLSLIAALAGSCLVLSAQHDLDDLSPQELAQALEDELDDLFDELGLDEDEEYPDQDLYNEIMIALSDQGDDDDESVITFAELKEEVGEARTTVEAVVLGAVQAADQMSRQESPSSRIVVAKSSGDSPVFWLSNASLGALAQQGNRRGWAVAGVAKRQTVGGFTNTVRRAR